MKTPNKKAIYSIKKLIEESKTQNLYQVVLLGSVFYREKLMEELSKHRLISVVEATSVDLRFPHLYLYYCQSQTDANNKSGQDISALVEENRILPIIEDTSNINSFIPNEISSVNAFQLDRETKVVELVNYILEYFDLYASKRKVFISYRRNECSGLADQIFTLLVKKGFKPFLDSYVIEPGVDFQNKLKHELIDSDIFIFLNTPDYLNSKWCKEEIETAMRYNIGILQINFNHSKKVDVFNSKTLYVYQNTNKNKLYSDIFLQWILWNIESIRASCIEYRNASIAGCIMNRHSSEKLSIVNGMVINDTLSEIYVPCNYIPTSMDINKAYTKATTLSLTGFKMKLLFNGECCLESMKNHFDWLNRSLPITTQDINK